MFKITNTNKMDMYISGIKLCSVDITIKNLVSAYNAFIHSLALIENWEKPKFKLLYNQTGIIAVEQALFTIDYKIGKPSIVHLNYSKYNLPQNADLEEIIFVLANEFMKDIRDNAGLIAESIIRRNESYPQNHALSRLLALADSLETKTKEARKKYDIPEFLKKRFLEEEELLISTPPKAGGKLS